jgi:hypothetical protein
VHPLRHVPQRRAALRARNIRARSRKRKAVRA